jgi:apolipoprotein D and lipocalin family protein
MLIRMMRFILFAVLVLLIGGCQMKRDDGSPLQVVPFVDLKRYAGEWYEIARLPNTFQKDCVGSRATYTLRDDGKVTVLNQCHDKSLSGRLRQAKGKAWVVDKKTNAKLKVSFFWPFSGDYWIIELGKDYEYAVIGHPDRKYLWILSRTKTMGEELYQAILARLREAGYDTSKLIKNNLQ